MMFASAALSSIAGSLGMGTAAAAGTAAAGAAAGPLNLLAFTGAGAAGGGLSMGSLFGSILQGTATVAGAMSALRGGQEDARALELEAADAEADKVTEQITGEERRSSLRAKLLDNLGEHDVAYAASGIDLSFGTPVEAKRAAKEDAERAISFDLNTQNSRIARLNERAANLRRAAKQKASGGVLKALGIGAAGAADILERG